MPDDELPLSGLATLITSDPARTEAEGTRLMSPHRYQPGPGTGIQARLRAARLGSTTLVVGSYAGGGCITTTAPTDYYSLHLPLRGGFHVRHGCTESVGASGSTLVLSPCDTLHMRWTDALTQLAIRIPAVVVQRVHHELTGHAGCDQPVFLPSGHAGRSPAWLPSLKLALNVVERGRGSVLPAVAEGLERTLVLSLLLDQPHQDSAALFTPAPARVRGAVRTAAAEMRERLAEPLTISSLARSRGISARSLQSGFRAEFGVTPSEYLRRLRLDRSREFLTHGHGSVAVIAPLCGFTHLGRFAHAYRRRFGVSPSETLRGKR